MLFFGVVFFIENARKIKKTFRNRQPGAFECTGLFTPQAAVFLISNLEKCRHFSDQIKIIFR